MTARSAASGHVADPGLRGRTPLIGLAGSIVLAVVPFLPWLRLGEVGVTGMPDPAGFFVLALGTVGCALAAVDVISARDMRQWLFLVGLAALTALVVVWWTGPDTIADRALARAQALAIVDKVSFQPPPPVRVGLGLVVGIAAAVVVLVVGATGVRAERQ